MAYQPVGTDVEAGRQQGYGAPPYGGYPATAPPDYPPGQYPPPGQQYPPGQYPPGQYPPPAGQYPPTGQQYPPLQQPYPGQQPPPYGAAPAYTEPIPEMSDPGISAFSEKSVRNAFIRKVYGLLFCQLMVSIAIVCLFVLHKGVNRYVRNSMGMFWTAWIATIVIMIAIACCESVRRNYPLNLIMLGLFTLCESYLLGVVSAHYKVDEVLMAMGIVAVLTLAITIFAFQTKIDFTMMSGCLFVALIVLICFGILTIFFHSKIVRLIYACLGALIFGLYLVMDTQMMMGGNKKYSISPEEYIFAALNLYVDIVTLFLYILQIIGIAKN